MPQSRTGPSLRRRLITIILLTSVAVVVLTCAALFTYEFVSFRRAMTQELSTLAKIIAANSTAALAFENRSDAEEVLAALKAEPNVVAAALYDRDGRRFAQYGAGAAEELLPETVTRDDRTGFANGHAQIFQSVVQGSNERLGTLFLMAGMGKLHQRLRIYGTVVAMLMVVSVAAAYFLGRALQRKISEPILELANIANAVSRWQDYSVRAPVVARGELGLLTEAFNHMLTRIQEQTESLSLSEARHRLLFESSPMPMWVYDLETLRFLAVNAAAITFYGFSAEEFRAMTVEDIREPNDRAARPGGPAEAESASAISSHGARIWKHRRKDGSTLLVEITSYDLEFEGRNGRLVLANDVTARVAAEAEIRRLNQSLEERVHQRTAQLEAANKELESFSYSISHDLRAPLRHIQGYVAMLNRATEGMLPEKARRYLKIINEAGVEMGQLIDDLLEFSRMGRTEMIEARVELDALVRDSVQRQQAANPDRDIVWKISPLPVVSGDAAMLRQVFANLIGNAVKYSRRRTPAIIEIGAKDGPDGQTTVFVRDNGAGFDMKYAHKLFGVFQRLHRPEEFEGTGIGLATVRRVVSRHGGTVWAESAIDAGATFFFTLRKPVEPSNVPAKTQPS